MGARLSFPYRGATVVPPVGAVIAWLKDYTSTPALGFGWVECNGQVLSDADSVYNGQTIPNLNNSGATATNAFLRGSTTSGGTGGSTTTGTTAADSTAPGAGAGASFTSGHSHTGNEPPYYNVVWIMRVK